MSELSQRKIKYQTQYSGLIKMISNHIILLNTLLVAS